MASGSKLCSKVFKRNNKYSKQYYSLVSNDVVNRAIDQANSKRLVLESYMIDGKT